MQNIFLLEPGSSGKRRNYTEKIISLDRGNRISLSDIKMRLNEIRDNSLTHQEDLIDKLATVLSGSVDIDLIMAADASKAIKKITEISGSCPIATNKSDVVKSELVPKILSAGIPVIEEWISEHYIHHVPLAILATGLEIVAIVLAAIGLILDSITHQDKRAFERELLNK